MSGLKVNWVAELADLNSLETVLKDLLSTLLKKDDMEINGSLGKEANVLPTSATATAAVAVAASATLEDEGNDADNASKIVSLVCTFMSANYKKLTLMLYYRIRV